MIFALLFEVGMQICFGVSWPIACVKAYKRRTTKGISLVFVLLILTGYGFGIIYKILSGPLNFVITAYIINFSMVFLYAIIFLRNHKIDHMQEHI